MLAGIHQNYGTPVPIVGNLPPASRTAFGGDRRIVGDGVMEEIWKPVVGYEGLYEISNHGGLRSVFKRRFGKKPCAYRARTMAVKPCRKGYLRVSLCKGGVKKKKLVHHLVLEAFIGFRPQNFDGCHGDNNPANNHISNLRWDTRKGNHADKRIHGTMACGERCGASKLKASQVKEIRQFRHDNQAGPKLLVAHFGIAEGTINDIIYGKTWRHIL